MLLGFRVAERVVIMWGIPTVQRRETALGELVGKREEGLCGRGGGMRGYLLGGRKCGRSRVRREYVAELLYLILFRNNILRFWLGFCLVGFGFVWVGFLLVLGLCRVFVFVAFFVTFFLNHSFCFGAAVNCITCHNYNLIHFLDIFHPSHISPPG